MKKVLVSILIGTMVTGMLLTGCGDTTQNQAQEETEEVMESEPEALTDGTEITAEPEDETEILTEEEDGYPVFSYADDPYQQAIWEYFRTKIVPGYAKADISLPIFDVFRTDDSDPEDVKVWGSFWVMNYNLRGTTLMTRSGGAYPGCFHLKEDGDGFTVTNVEFVADGTDEAESVDNIFGADEELKAAFAASSEDFNDALLNSVNIYKEKTGIEIKAYEDFGWDPVPLVFDEAFILEYPTLSGSWSADRFTAEIQDPLEGGTVYEIKITETTEDGAVINYSLNGQYEMSTDTLYYWDGWITNAEGDDIDNFAEGSFVLNEDNSLVWSREDAEDVVFVRE